MNDIIENTQQKSIENYPLQDITDILNDAANNPEAVLEENPPPPDYDELLIMTEELSKESSPEEIANIVQHMAACNALQREALEKEIKQRTGMTLQSQKEYLRKQEEAEATPTPDQLQIARDVIALIGTDNLLSTEAHLWRWYEAKGVWRADDERAIKQMVQHGLEKQGYEVSSNIVNSVTEVIKNDVYACATHCWNSKADSCTNFKNGELHWNDNTWELHPHCREHYFSTQIPHDYHAHAQCHRFMQFLTEIFIDDADKQDKATLVLEMIGYSLVAHARFEKFIILIGKGANGKSVLLSIIKHIVGAKHVAAVQPDQFSNKFQRAHLHNKLVNLVTEIPEGAMMADAEIKAITSGELITAEHKNKPPFDFSPFATCWFGTNHMPHTRDFSDGLFRRALILTFNRTFASHEKDTNLGAALQAEITGIIALSLKSYGEVIKRGGQFTIPSSSTNAVDKWFKEADQAQQFIEEWCEIDCDASIASGELYQKYQSWAGEAGISKKLNHQNFTARMERLGFQPAKTTGGKRIIKGIRLRWQ
jgi:putative DNA primase/helicase